MTLKLDQNQNVFGPDRGFTTQYDYITLCNAVDNVRIIFESKTQQNSVKKQFFIIITSVIRYITRSLLCIGFALIIEIFINIIDIFFFYFIFYSLIFSFKDYDVFCTFVKRNHLIYSVASILNMQRLVMFSFFFDRLRMKSIYNTIISSAHK